MRTRPRVLAVAHPLFPLAALATLATLALSSAGCSKKDDATSVAPSATALASSQAASGAKAWHLAIDPKSATRVDMPGLKEDIKGDTSAATGTLDVVPADLAQSRGTIKADLSTFTTHTFGDDHDATQTEHARTWLEAVVGGKTNEAMRWATFAIRSVDGLSATDLTKVAPTRDGGDDVRTVTMTVHGDMLVHGHQLQKDAPVEVAFRVPAGSPPDAAPAKVTVKSRQPLRIVLKEVDVQPRDTVGALTAWTTGLISKVAEFADVTVDLSAAPAPSP
jgi:hypothetical protein